MSSTPTRRTLAKQARGEANVINGLKLVGPWLTASQTSLEASQQRALMQWAAMVAFAGFEAARHMESYSVQGFAQRMVEQGWSKPEPRMKWFHAIHNQGHGDAIRGNKAKAEGLKKGVSDCMLPVMMTFDQDMMQKPWPFEGGFCGFQEQVSYAGLYIELKKEVGGKAKPEQLEFQAFTRSEGYACEVAHGWIEAAKLIEKYFGVNPI